MNDLSVIIPFYNERETLEDVVSRVLSRKEVSELILVDDGSMDGSYAIACKLSRKSKTIKVLRSKVNCGKGSAIIKGIKKSTGKYLVIQDADLELNPRVYPLLLKPLVEGTSDFSIGDRWPNHNGKFVTKLGGWLVTFITNILFGSNFKDTYCGYKMAPLSTWKNMKLKSQGFEIEAEIVAKAARRGLRVSQIVVPYNPRSYEAGKKIKAVDALKGIYTLLLIRFS